MLRRNKRDKNDNRKSKTDVVIVNKMRSVGNIKIKLVSRDKGPWEITIANANKGYSYTEMTVDEARELVEELKDLLEVK